MHPDQRTQLLDCLGHLYDAATDVDKWKPFLASLAGLFGANTAIINHDEKYYGQISFSVDYGIEHLGEARRNELRARYVELCWDDPFVPYLQKLPAKPINCNSILESIPGMEEQYRTMPIYRELRKPLGMEYILAVGMPADDESVTFVGLTRGPKDPPFDQDDANLLGELVPHFRRAIGLSKHLALLDFGKRAATAALDQLPTGVILADGAGAVRLINDAAKRIVDRSDGLMQRNGRVATADPRETAALLGHVRRLVDAAAQGRILPGEAMNISRPSGAAALPLVISPVWGNHLKFQLGRLDEPLAALFFTDPDVPLETPVELLQRLFGLTPAEASLAARLVSGDTLKQAANHLDITVNTARQRLKQVFDKTGVNRQAALVRLILTTPVWVKKMGGAGAPPEPPSLPAVL